MTAIVVVVVPMRETGTRRVNPIQGPGERDERDPQRKATGKGNKSDPPFWTWFIENPRGGDRVAI
jgi:hypothetical protein